MENFNTLTLFGETYSAQELIEKSQYSSNREKWENEYWEFIASWLNEDDYIMVYTSGSTGKPKRIRLSKEKMLVSARMTVIFFGLVKGDSALLCLSPRHIGGMMMIVRAFYAKLDLYILAPSANPLMDCSEKFKFAAFVPYQVSTILRETSDKIKNIDQILIGGGEVSIALEKSLESLQLNIYSSFGMTETISHFALRKIGANKNYICLPDISISQSSNGCMIIHAPQLHDEAIHTKDLIELNSSCSFLWLGRSDFAIESGGSKIIPEQIEEKLRPFIKERFFISSMKHKQLNNQIILIIEGASHELNEKIFGGLEKYHRPKQVFFIRQFKAAANGKIDRIASRKLLDI
tara:strand:- start:921 stop:1967 length:1047 start_codon:yes stop_codon:yes gene_type:complete